VSPDTGKTRETRLRRLAERQGLRLEKSPRRDPRASDFGTYQLVDAREGWTVLTDQHIAHGYGMSLDDIEAWLTQAYRMYKITAIMKVRPYPAPTTEQQARFVDAMRELHSSQLVMPAAVQWSNTDEAQVTLACGGHDSAAATDRAKAIIERNAANVAHIYVNEIVVLETEVLPGQ
jgi:hypothetical protein